MGWGAAANQTASPVCVWGLPVQPPTLQGMGEVWPDTHEEIGMS